MCRVVTSYTRGPHFESRKTILKKKRPRQRPKRKKKNVFVYVSYQNLVSPSIAVNGIVTLSNRSEAASKAIS